MRIRIPAFHSNADPDPYGIQLRTLMRIRTFNPISDGAFVYCMCCRQIPGFPVYGMGQPQEAGFTQLAEKLPKGSVSSSKLNPLQKVLKQLRYLL
jgi:hypothetical protein